MKKIFLLFLGATVGIQFAPVATADMITPHSGPITGYESGVGFSFVPLVNLQITQLGYQSYNGSDPVISIWSGTNVIGGWDFGTDSGTNGQMFYTPYSQNLTAGQQYSITLQDPDLGIVIFDAYLTNGVGFSVSPQLTNYVGFFVTATGTFTNFSTNFFYLGANFAATSSTNQPHTNASLSSLGSSAGTLTPGFSASVTNYTASVPTSVSNVTVTPVAADLNATIQVRINFGSYNAVASGATSAALPLNVGNNYVEVKVVAQDNVTSRIYTLTVNRAAPPTDIHHIIIDGDFSDWASVPSYFDPVGTNVQNGIPNTHDTDGSTPDYIPVYVNHPDVDLLEYKFTHDVSNLYAYFRASGVIGNTISNATQQGRYYVIVTIDVDNNTNTGYGLHEGGYFPTSYGYDMNMEFEFYGGHPNKGNYLNHGATNQTQLNAAFQDQINGIVRVLPGSYDYYPEWVWFDTPSGPNSGTNNLPPPDDYASIRFVRDKGPSYQGIVRIALSPDGHQAEMVAPFRGFMRDPTQPHTNAPQIIALGKTINVSFSLEASGELAPGGQWASNTAEPIVGYYLSPPKLQISSASPGGNVTLSWDAGAVGSLLQRSFSLANPDWQVVAGSGTTNQVTWLVGTNNVFFRLLAP